ncbi:MAG: hypothetical protein ACOYXM_06255 [Actinomycetota bacterium]
MSRHRSRALLAVVLAAVVSACVSPGEPGVNVDTVQADIVFGVEQPPVGEVPPPTATGGPPSNGGLAPELRVPFFNRVGSRFSNVQYTVPSSDADCPTASPTEAPDVVAPDNASEPPAAGLYVWQRSGEQTVVVEGASYKSTISGYENRLVRAVDKISETRWTFELVQPDLSGATLVTTYAVNTDPTEVENPTTGNRGVAAPYVGQTTRAGEPLRGLTLERQEYYDGNGILVGEFDPADPVLLAPLPVLSGETWTSVGVDPRSGQTIRVDGIMSRRESVDACGSRLDAWLSDMTVTYSGDSETVRQLDLYVSTELGGMPIGERISESSNDGGKLDAFFEIGQRDPDPAPEEES